MRYDRAAVDRKLDQNSLQIRAALAVNNRARSLHLIRISLGGRVTECVMKHPAGAHHYDGAKDEEVIVQLMGMGPSTTTRLKPNEGLFGRSLPSQPIKK